jgi:hypothetical protein
MEVSAQSMHADIVHGADTQPHYPTAQTCPARLNHEEEPKAGKDHGNANRINCPVDRIGNRKAGLERQHGNKVHRPNAGPENERRRGYPDIALPTAADTDTRQQRSGGPTGKRAKEHRYRDEAKIMVVRDASQDV